MTLPADLDVTRQLSGVRLAVLEATHRVRSPKRSTQYRAVRLSIIAAAAALALTAGTIIVQATQEERDHSTRCYQDSSRDSEVMEIVTGDAGFGQPGTSTPIELCAHLWKNYAFAPDLETDDNPDNGDFPVPELVACRAEDGVAVVFPRVAGDPSPDDFCEALRLADWSSD